MRKLMSLLPVVLAPFVAAGCSDRDAAQWAGNVTDSAGITIVANPDVGLWTDTDRWQVEQVLSIGTAEGDPDYQFGQVAALTVLDDGRIYVLDTQGQHVKAFSPAGEFLMTIGGPGNGPGELARGASAIVRGPGDTLLVVDSQNQRVNRYLTDGTTAGSFRLSITDGIPLRMAGSRQGLLVGQFRPLALPNQPAPDSMDVVVSRNAVGEIVDTLFTFRSGASFSFASGRPEFKLFSSEPIWALRPGPRIMFGVNSEYRIGTYAADGTLERIITKPFTRDLVSEADQQTLINAMERVWKQFGVPPQQLAVLKDGIGFAEFYPAYFQTLSGPNESIWVQQLQTPASLSGQALEDYNPQTDLGSPNWDVFDSDGRFLGVVRMPNRFQPLQFLDDRIYGIGRDELDVQYVIVMRINGAVATD
ncbi:MAG TPA: 6-bladed beta-propeller [Gemmatimonadales bacterium]